MPVSGDGSYFSRVLVKFLEIFAAGLATAVSGYLIAHLSGVFSAPAPMPVGTAIQVAPTPTTVSGGPSVQPAPPATTVSGGQSVQLAPPASTNVSEQPLARQEETGTRQEETVAPIVAQPPDGAANATKAAAARKHIETDTSAAESKRRQDSVLARVRAALANRDAKRAKAPDAPPRQANAPQGPTPAGAQPRPLDDRRAASVAVPPPDTANLQPPPLQQSAAQPAAPAPAPIEIEPRPIVPAQTEPAAPAQEETGALSTLGRDPLTATDDAPRPPMPVGQ